MLTGSGSDNSWKICWSVRAQNLGLEISFSFRLVVNLQNFWKIHYIFASRVNVVDDVEPVLAQRISSSMLSGHSSDDEAHEHDPESGDNILLEIFCLVVLSVPDVVQERLKLLSRWFLYHKTPWVCFHINRLKKGRFIDGNCSVADDCGLQGTIFEFDTRKCTMKMVKW